MQAISLFTTQVISPPPCHLKHSTLVIGSLLHHAIRCYQNSREPEKYNPFWHPDIFLSYNAIKKKLTSWTILHGWLNWKYKLHFPQSPCMQFSCFVLTFFPDSRRTSSTWLERLWGLSQVHVLYATAFVSPSALYTWDCFIFANLLVCIS